MKLLLITLVAALTGCVSATVLSSTPRNVIVDAPMRLSAEAAALAEQECKKYGKHAQFNATLGRRNMFSCVD